MHLLQCRCPHIPHALLVSTLVPYLSWGTIFVCRPYFMLFLSTNKFVAGQIKTSYYPPPPLPPHRTKYSSLYVCRIYWFLMSTIFCRYWIPTYVGYDTLFQTRILCSKKAVHLLQRRCCRISQASLVSALVQSIPNWNTLLKKGCASAAAQMSPHSTGIAS